MDSIGGFLAVRSDGFLVDKSGGLLAVMDKSGAFLVVTNVSYSILPTHTNKHTNRCNINSNQTIH